MGPAKRIFASLAILAASATGAAADEAMEKAIEARQALMKLYSFNLAVLGDMAKGEREYDEEAAATAATNLHTLAQLDTTALWPAGSDITAFPDTTRALEEAWTTFPAIVEDQEAFVAASAQMADVAGGGIDSLREHMKALGDSCGACHESYRQEE